MAQLDRNPEGLKMGELSARLMVTGGNVTGITDQLEEEGGSCGSPTQTTAAPIGGKLTPAGRGCSPTWRGPRALGRRPVRGIERPEKEQTIACSPSSSTGCSDPGVVAPNDKGEERRIDGEMNAALAAGNRTPIAGYQAKHFLWSRRQGRRR